MVPVAVTVTSLTLLVVKALFLPKDAFDDSASLGLLIIACLPWVSYLVASIKGPGGWEFVFREQQRELHQIKEEQRSQRSNTEKRIQLVLAALDNFLTEDKIEFLMKLQRREPIIFSDAAHNKQRYRDILRHLRLLGLIAPQDSISHIVDETTEGKDITPKLPLTASGEALLRDWHQVHQAADT